MPVPQKINCLVEQAGKPVHQRLVESAIQSKKTRPKIGRELINQGASTKLVSGISMPLSGLFRKFAKICGKSAIAQKKPGQIWSGVINQSGCIYQSSLLGMRSRSGKPQFKTIFGARELHWLGLWELTKFH